jgi:DNA-binding GntR family transcriptional regulator
MHEMARQMISEMVLTTGGLAGRAQRGSARANENGREAGAPPTRDRVYNFVRRAILVGEYPGGTFIEEEEISSRVGVSRTPVREAFHRLHGDQYIDLVPRKGALVRQVNVQELAGMYQARLMIEGSVMELVCRERLSISPEIAATIEKMRDAKDVETPDGQLAFIALDWHLHCSIVEMCGNDVIVEMYKSLRSRYDRVGMMVDLSSDHLGKIYREHLTLLGMLQSYDIVGLREILAQHLSVAA